MSAESWFNEFIAQGVDIEKGKGEELARMMEEHPSPIRHSFNKWLGFTPENLSKHNVTIKRHGYDVWVDSPNDTYSITGWSCALCHQFSCEGNPNGKPLCPLAEHFMRCDDKGDFEASKLSAWHRFTRPKEGQHPDPYPMIAQLKYCLELED